MENETILGVDEEQIKEVLNEGANLVNTVSQLSQSKPAPQPVVPEVSTEPTAETIEPEVVDEPETEKNLLQKVFGEGGGLAGSELFDYSGGGFIHGGGQGPGEFYSGDFKESISATGQGLIDTATDALNWVSPPGVPDIPKADTYENLAAESLRKISGLVIPSLIFRGAMIQQGQKMHASQQAAPWLRKLGDRKSFEFISKMGIDVFTGGLVDYVAEQNQYDDNLVGTLKKYWPRTYQWIPDRYATTDMDSPDQKRMKNVNEGAIFNMLASVVEGVAYIVKAEQSVSRTSKFIGSNDLKTLTKDEFTDVTFSDNPVEDSVLRNYARKEKELNDLSAYFLEKGVDPDDIPGLNSYWDETETLVRAKDQDGIIGAAVDQAQIANNIDTSYGRLSNIITERARLEGLELQNLTDRTLVSNLSQELKRGGKFSKRLNSGEYITDKIIDDSGKKLAATLLDPRVDSDDVLRLLSEFKESVENSPVRLVGKKGINKAIQTLKEQMIDLDVQKARAYLVTSEAGQVADMSEGIRLMDDVTALNRSVDLMANRLEHLMIEKGLAKYEANTMLSNIKAWKEAVASGDKNIINKTAETILDNNTAQLREIIPEAKAWSKTLRGVAAENPEFLKPLLLANEFTDGNVDTLFKLHKWASQNLATFRKAAIDRTPEVPSIINKVWFGNLFNSTLSAFGTPIKAAVGNLTGLLGIGSSTVVGAVRSGDLNRAHKAMIAHFSLDDTLMKSLDHMRIVFRKAATDPKGFAYITRSDIAIKEEAGLESLRAYAKAAEANNEFGATALLNIYDDLEAMSLDPALRFGANSMTALDGFAKSVNASTQAKYKAIWKLQQAGEEINEKNLKQAADEIYSTFFDQNDMINDQTVNAMTSEIALNANSPLVDGVNNLVRRFPAIKPYVMFPKTEANIIDTFGKWSPAGILSADYWKLWGKPIYSEIPGKARTLDSFGPDEVKAIFAEKGIAYDNDWRETLQRLRYEVRGKAAIGSFFTTLAFMALANDRCTGTTGHYNKGRQTSRLNNNWKSKSCRVPGTNTYVSYEWMGPIGDWLGLQIDIADNFDLISVTKQEEFRQKMAAIIAGAFTNRTLLSSLEPLHDILQGNGWAANRFLSNFMNNSLPLGAQRAELGRLMNPGLRIVRNELEDHIRNKNPWLDSIDPNNSLPFMRSPIDGKRIGYEENWFLRAWNIYSGIKIHKGPSKEQRWLNEIEYNSSPHIRMSSGGAILEPTEIEAIQSKMGELGGYKKDLNRIMRKAENLEYNGIKGFRNILKAERNGNVPSSVVDSTQYKSIFAEITKAFNKNKKIAEGRLPLELRSAIREREIEVRNNKLNNKFGMLDRLHKQAYPEEHQEILDVAN